MNLTGMIHKGQGRYLESSLQLVGSEGRISIIVLELFAGPSVVPNHFSSLWMIINSSHFPAFFFAATQSTSSPSTQLCKLLLG